MQRPVSVNDRRRCSSGRRLSPGSAGLRLQRGFTHDSPGDVGGTQQLPTGCVAESPYTVDCSASAAPEPACRPAWIGPLDRQNAPKIQGARSSSRMRQPISATCNQQAESEAGIVRDGPNRKATSAAGGLQATECGARKSDRPSCSTAVQGEVSQKAAKANYGLARTLRSVSPSAKTEAARALAKSMLNPPAKPAASDTALATSKRSAETRPGGATDTQSAKTHGAGATIRGNERSSAPRPESQRVKPVACAVSRTVSAALQRCAPDAEVFDTAESKEGVPFRREVVTQRSASSSSRRAYASVVASPGKGDRGGRGAQRSGREAHTPNQRGASKSSSPRMYANQAANSVSSECGGRKAVQSGWKGRTSSQRRAGFLPSDPTAQKFHVASPVAEMDCNTHGRNVGRSSLASVASTAVDSESMSTLTDDSASSSAIHCKPEGRNCSQAAHRYNHDRVKNASSCSTDPCTLPQTDSLREFAHMGVDRVVGMAVADSSQRAVATARDAGLGETIVAMAGVFLSALQRSGMDSRFGATSSAADARCAVGEGGAVPRHPADEVAVPDLTRATKRSQEWSSQITKAGDAKDVKFATPVPKSQEACDSSTSPESADAARSREDVRNRLSWAILTHDTTLMRHAIERARCLAMDDEVRLGVGALEDEEARETVQHELKLAMAEPFDRGRLRSAIEQAQRLGLNDEVRIAVNVLAEEEAREAVQTNAVSNGGRCTIAAPVLPAGADNGMEPMLTRAQHVRVAAQAQEDRIRNSMMNDWRKLWISDQGMHPSDVNHATADTSQSENAVGEPHMDAVRSPRGSRGEKPNPTAALRVGSLASLAPGLGGSIGRAPRDQALSSLPSSDSYARPPASSSCLGGVGGSVADESDTDARVRQLTRHDDEMLRHGPPASLDETGCSVLCFQDAREKAGCLTKGCAAGSAASSSSSSTAAGSSASQCGDVADAGTVNLDESLKEGDFALCVASDADANASSKAREAAVCETSDKERGMSDRRNAAEVDAAFAEAALARDAHSLRVAIADARRMGMYDLASKAAVVLQEVEAEERISCELMQAVEAGDACQLKRVIALAQSVGVKASTVASGRAALRALEERQLEVSMIEARKENDMNGLNVVLAKAHQLECDGIAELAADWIEELKAQRGVSVQLVAAVHGGSSKEHLASAICAAKACGCSGSPLDRAEAVFASLQDQEEVEAALSSAIESRDVSALRAATARARQIGIDSQDLATEASIILSAEEVREAAQRDLALAVDERTDIARIQAAIQVAEKSGVAEAIVAAASRALRRFEQQQEVHTLLAAAARRSSCMKTLICQASTSPCSNTAAEKEERQCTSGVGGCCPDRTREADVDGGVRGDQGQTKRCEVSSRADCSANSAGNSGEPCGSFKPKPSTEADACHQRIDKQALRASPFPRQARPASPHRKSAHVPSQKRAASSPPNIQMAHSPTHNKANKQRLSTPERRRGEDGHGQRHATAAGVAWMISCDPPKQEGARPARRSVSPTPLRSMMCMPCMRQPRSASAERRSFGMFSKEPRFPEEELCPRGSAADTNCQRSVSPRRRTSPERQASVVEQSCAASRSPSSPPLRPTVQQRHAHSPARNRVSPSFADGAAKEMQRLDSLVFVSTAAENHSMPSPSTNRGRAIDAGFTQHRAASASPPRRSSASPGRERRVSNVHAQGRTPTSSTCSQKTSGPSDVRALPRSAPSQTGNQVEPRKRVINRAPPDEAASRAHAKAGGGKSQSVSASKPLKGVYPCAAEVSHGAPLARSNEGRPCVVDRFGYEATWPSLLGEAEEHRAVSADCAQDSQQTCGVASHLDDELMHSQCEEVAEVGRPCLRSDTCLVHRQQQERREEFDEKELREWYEPVADSELQVLTQLARIERELDVLKNLETLGQADEPRDELADAEAEEQAGELEHSNHHDHVRSFRERSLGSIPATGMESEADSTTGSWKSEFDSDGEASGNLPRYRIRGSERQKRLSAVTAQLLAERYRQEKLIRRPGSRREP